MCNPANPAMSLLTFIQGGVEITGDQAAEGAETLAEGVQGYAEQSILDVLIDSWYINVPLLILSVLAVYIFFERTMSINRALKEESNFMSKIKDYIFDGKIEAASGLCASTDTPVARMLEKGIGRIGKSMDDIKSLRYGKVMIMNGKQL